VDIIRYTADLLYQQGSCEWPGVGRFRLQYSAAVIDSVNHLIFPPTEEIIFEELTEGVPLRMIRYIAQRENIPEPQANETFAKCMLHIKFQLTEGIAVPVPFLGSLQRDLQGKTSFTPLDRQFQLREPLQAIPLKDPEKQLVDIPPTMVEAVVDHLGILPSNPGNSRFSIHHLWMLAMAIFLMLIGMVLFLRDCTQNKALNKVKKISPPTGSIRTPVLHSAIKKLALQPVNQPGQPGITDSIRYYIVFASYSNQARAQKIYHRIRHWGHPVVILGDRNGPFRLAVPFWSKAGDTLKNLESVRKNYGPSAYILP